MKSNAYFLGLSALSNEATQFAQHNFGDNWFVTVTACGVEFKMTRAGYKDVRSFRIDLNSDRVPVLHFPAMAVNFPAAASSQNCWLMKTASELMWDSQYRGFLVRLFEKLTDLNDDASMNV